MAFKNSVKIIDELVAFKGTEEQLIAWKEVREKLLEIDLMHGFAPGKLTTLPQLDCFGPKHDADHGKVGV